MNLKSDDLLEAWGAFFLAHALSIRAIEEHMGSNTPLTLDEYDIMLGISRAVGGRIRYSALANATVFTRSGITRVTKRLEQRGFVKRVECEEDRRGAFASLTAEGRAAMRETWRLYSKAIITLLDPCLDRADARRFKEMLEKIIHQTRGESLVQIAVRRKTH